MIRMKVGGMILTGYAAFLMVNKIVNSTDSAISRICETAKWRGYYKCWANGKAQGEPLAPGYSRTTRPDKADFEIVDDPTGADHSKDNDPKTAEGAKSTDAAKAVVEAVKDIAEKVVDNLTKPSSEPREASEGQIEASGGDEITGTKDIAELITNMAFGGATSEELERAIRYSMDVIEAKKRPIDLAKSMLDNHILELTEKYKGKVTERDENGKPIAGRYPWGDTDGDEPLKDVINDAFTNDNAVMMNYSETEKETDQDETVD